MTRRGALKLLGAGAAGAGALGPGGLAREAEGIAPVIVAGVAGGSFLVGAGAGAAAYHWGVDDDGNIDPDEQLEDEIYRAAEAVAYGRDDYQEQYQTEYISPTDPQDTPYGDAAWQELRAVGVEAGINSDPASNATSDGTESLEYQTTRSVVNVVERWNEGIHALVPYLVKDAEQGTGAFSLSSSTGPVTFEAGELPDNEWEVNSASELESGEYVVIKLQVDTPVNANKLDGRDEPLYLHTVMMNDMANPVSPLHSGDAGGVFTSSSSGAGDTILATSSNLGSIDILDSVLYGNVLNTISTAYQQIRGDVETFINSLYDGLDTGSLDPSDVYGPADVVERFAQGSTSRAAAEMMAIGGAVAEDTGYRAEIEHPDVSGGSRWGHLVLSLVDGVSVDVSPDSTVAAADFELGYFAFETDAGRRLKALSGTDPIEVLDVKGVDGQTSVDATPDGQTVGTDGEVVVYEGDSPPEALSSPSDHAGWVVSIHTGTGKEAVSVQNLSTSGDQYLASTSLEAESTVQLVEIVPPTSYSEIVQHEADATAVDSADTVQRIEDLRDAIDELEAASDGGGGGGIPGGTTGLVAALAAVAAAGAYLAKRDERNARDY